MLTLPETLVDKLPVPGSPLNDTEPDTDGDPKAEVNPADPPEPGVPLTTRRAESLIDVSLVQPVGADEL